MKKIFLFITVPLLFTFFLQSCQPTDKQEEIKYCFLFIGDGMGVAQVNLTEAYLAAVNNEKGFRQLSFTKFPHAGLVSTFANNRFITCSAAAGTAFATGNKTNINHISTDSTGNVPFTSIATMCKNEGMKVGILSSVSIDHATPAVFYANNPSRDNYFEIGLDLVNSNFDFFGGGGFKTPDGMLNNEKVNLYKLAEKNEFKVTNSQTGLQELKAGEGSVLAVYPNLLKSGAMPYVIDNPDGPSLADFTRKAIELLENEAGFFMMVEGGKIDWACHDNDAATSIMETIAFDEAIQVAVNFYHKHPEETLIVVTADHETGGLALGAKKTKYESYFDLLQHQKISYENFTQKVSELQNDITGNFDNDLKVLLELVAEYFGLGTKIPLEEEEKSNIWFAFEKDLKSSKTSKNTYSDHSYLTAALIKLMSEKAGVGWTTFSHTGINIPIYAIGPGAEMFSGTIDNTDIPKIMMKQLGISD